MEDFKNCEIRGLFDENLQELDDDAMHLMLSYRFVLINWQIIADFLVKLIYLRSFFFRPRKKKK
jgi:hypothetical protein